MFKSIFLNTNSAKVFVKNSFTRYLHIKRHKKYRKNQIKNNYKTNLIFKQIQKLTFLKTFCKKNKKQLKKNTKITDLYNFNHTTDRSSKFFSHFFFKLFKRPFYIINFNYYTKVKIKKFKKFVNSVFFKNNFFKKTIYMYKLLKIAFASLIYKDTKLLEHMIRNSFERIHYSKHRIYFFFWRNLIHYIFAKHYKKCNIFGVRLEFHGKLGVGGNSKKRSYYYSMGQCSNSNKELKIDSTQSFFWTATGTVGFTYSIFY